MSIVVHSLLNELNIVLKNHKEKPYLPVWGELFNILKKVKKEGKKTRNILIFYQIEPTGTVKYDYKKNKFIVEIPDINIILSEDELINSLLLGRFLPKG